MHHTTHPTYLVHFNKNHDSKNGQFTYGDGDGDGISDDHHNSRKYKRNKKYIDKEIAFQNKKIKTLKERKEKYDNAIKDINKSGMSELLNAGYDKNTARQAVKEVVSRSEIESKWIAHQIKNLEIYNKKISEIDVSDMSLYQVHSMINKLGNETLAEINKFDEINGIR